MRSLRKSPSKSNSSSRPPHRFHRVDPFLAVGVARLVVALGDAEHGELALVPAADDVEAETPLPHKVGGHERLGGDDRVEERRVNGGEHRHALGIGQQPRRPGDRLQRLALIVGLAAIALPPADGQHEIDAGVLGHPGERQVVGPVARPAFGHAGHGAPGRAVGAEQAELEPVGVVHRQPGPHMLGPRCHTPPFPIAVRFNFGTGFVPIGETVPRSEPRLGRWVDNPRATRPCALSTKIKPDSNDPSRGAGAARPRLRLRD